MSFIQIKSVWIGVQIAFLCISIVDYVMRVDRTAKESPLSKRRSDPLLGVNATPKNVRLGSHFSHSGMTRTLQKQETPQGSKRNKKGNIWAKKKCDFSIIDVTFHIIEARIEPKMCFLQMHNATSP